jgi:hypothetical protein
MDPVAPTDGPGGINRRGAEEPSLDTSHSSPVSPFVASAFVITLNRTQRPSGEISGAAIVFTR